MTESSSEYWKHPRLYASKEELRVSLPEYYAHESLNPLNEWIGKQLIAHGVDNILEVGCNCGRNVAHLLSLGLNARGVEISPEAVEYAKTAFPTAYPHITLMDAELYLACQDSFGAIFTQGVLMHVPHNSGLFAEIARVASDLILVNEVERPKGIIERHKYSRSYKALFEGLGWQEVFSAPFRTSMTRVFRRI